MGHMDDTTTPRESILGSEDMYTRRQFAEATRVGDTVWLSGQRGFDAQGNISDDPAEQARVTFANIAELLEKAGSSLADIVSLTSYHVDMADFEGFHEVKREFIREPYPSWTAVGVSALANPRMKIEVAAVAVIGSGRNARRIG